MSYIDNKSSLIRELHILELDLTIIPNMGNIHLYWNGKNYDHLKVTRRQIVKHTNETILYITFEKYI